ncbi:DUF2993 domain-containing protein [Frankia sp. AiPs1]|uniref:LmeA family phospholipid-binding protein n=1 Tax=Frankia sp. AiPs1 TaxID=573493 RepID=UPI0020433E7F|nr:DUF2993 domain-containing protein [Frankia sp. AiPs1]MCM3922130.1 DUF2993 domain-containing protein [Frankia sp. AiPs1]
MGRPWSEKWSRTGGYTVASPGAGAAVPTAADDESPELPAQPADSPERAAATRRTRTTWRRRPGRVGIVFIVLTALVAQFLVVDRVAVAFAKREMASQIRSGALAGLPCDTPPPTVSDVSIGGFPFLTQVLTGSFSDVGMTMTGLPTTGPRVERISAHVRGVHVPIFKLATGGDGTIRIDDMRAAVRMTYADLNAFLRTQPGRVHITPVDGGSRLEITATANIPLLGEQQVGGVTTFAVHDNRVMLVPSEISLRGLFDLTFPLGNLGSYVPQIPIPVGDLPFDLTVTNASTDATGLSLAATASNIKVSTADQKPCRPTGS